MARNIIKEQRSPLRKVHLSRKIDTTGAIMSTEKTLGKELKSYSLLKNDKLFNKTSLFERNIETKISSGVGSNPKVVFTKEYVIESVSSENKVLSSHIYENLDSATEAFNSDFNSTKSKLKDYPGFSLTQISESSSSRGAGSTSTSGT